MTRAHIKWRSLSLATFLTLGIMPLAAALADERADMIDKLFHDFDKPGAPGASVMVIRNGKVLCARAYGLANVEKSERNTTATNFRLASLSKQFTAMAIMILADAGKLRLDDSITNFFPEFPEYGKAITVRHLLNHTSGLVDYEDVIPKGTTLPVLDFNVLRLLMQQDHALFPAGSKFQYSNSGYALLALIVERVSGKTFASFLKRQIFKPLGMTNTVAYESGISQVAHRAFGYTQAGEQWKLNDQSLTSSVLGDGGVYSSVEDLFKWDQALYGTRLVSRKILKAAFTPGNSTLHDKGVEYGFGWFLSEYRGLRNIWHYGSTVGFATRISRFPDKKFTVIILSNRDNAPLTEMLNKIVDLYLFDAK
jgi:CubicO group peptidase (beta-lactamase class C family)